MQNKTNFEAFLNKKNMRYLLHVSLLLLILSLKSVTYSQIALAVSKNDNGSSVKYSLQVGNTMEEAYSKAQAALEEQDLKNIFVLKSTENTGHNLKSGFYVLIISSRKILGGKFFVSYGLGVSPNSRQEAINRAVEHLKEHDWGYENEYGYAFEKEGKIEDFYVTGEKK